MEALPADALWAALVQGQGLLYPLLPLLILKQGFDVGPHGHMHVEGFHAHALVIVHPAQAFQD